MPRAAREHSPETWALAWRHKGLALRVIRRCARIRGLPPDRVRRRDYLIDGLDGLCYALEGYRVEEGKFAAFADKIIYVQVMHAIDEQESAIHVPRNERSLVRALVRAGRPASGRRLRAAFEVLARRVFGEREAKYALELMRDPRDADGRDLTLRDEAEAGLGRLSPEQAETLRRRYGIGGPEQTLEEIGAALGVSGKVIKRYEREALNRLRWHLGRGDDR